MRHISLLFMLWIGFNVPVANAQDTGQPMVVCEISGCSEVTLQKPRFSGANAFAVEQVWTVVDDILHLSGLLPNFQVIETKEVANAAAVIIDGERYLAVNLDWLKIYDTNIKDDWHLYGLMAHEVGHHLQGHTISGTGSRPPTELEADEYAGFTLAALGANLDQAQTLWSSLPERGSSTHPPRHQRLAAVERGWLRRSSQNVTPQVTIPKSEEKPTVIPAPTAMVTEPTALVTEPIEQVEKTPTKSVGISTKIKDAKAKIQASAPPIKGTKEKIRESTATVTTPSDPPPPIWAKRNCMPVLAVNQRAKLCFSSVLSSQGTNNYLPKNIKDNNSQTAWVEGVSGQGIGEAFTVIFNDRTQVNQFAMRNGYAKSAKTYSRNSRVHKLSARASNGMRMSLTLLDTSDWQSITALSEFGPVAWINFEISSVYAGTHYKDTAITELAFD